MKQQADSMVGCVFGLRAKGLYFESRARYGCFPVYVQIGTLWSHPPGVVLQVDHQYGNPKRQGFNSPGQ